jgi:outer membrane protein OmpA-like peptidoglycan-associated protein
MIRTCLFFNILTDNDGVKILAQEWQYMIFIKHSSFSRINHLHGIQEVAMKKLKLVWLALFFIGIAHAQEMDLQVELMNRVSTETSRKGDLVSARIISPAAFQGSLLEGKVQESISGSKSRGESVLDIQFDMLRQGSTVTPINSRVKSVANSKGEVNVDEDGRVISRSGEKKPSRTSGLGRALGGLGGGKVERIGSAIDNAAAALFRLSSDAPNLRFDAGAKFTVAASTRSGPALASLASNRPAAAINAAPAASAPAPSAPAAAPSTSGQPNFTLVKDEFIPGDNTVFYDDFSDMGPGDAPPHFKVRGGTPDLMEGGGAKQLTLNAKGSLIPNLKSLPPNFTFETEVKFNILQGRAGFTLILLSKGKQILQWWAVAQGNTFDLVVSLRAPYQELGRKRVNLNFEQPMKLALWVQNGRMRSYVNGAKILDFNQVEMPPIDSVEFENGFLGANPSLGYRMVRFAESTPDFSQILMSSGRYIARGILFDTDKDIIKPESGPVIKLIAQALEKNPNLKLLIEGHTDSVGNADHNLDLSRRRAEAVKSVLVSQFSVDESRLSAAGLGSSKPVDSNDTPQGRSQNRRVELVKQ